MSDSGTGVDSGPLTDAGEAPDAGSCRAIEAAAEAVGRPADIILLIDSSASMGTARGRIAAVINSDFDEILNRSGIDYRVLVVADVSILTLGGDLASYDPPRLFHVNIGTGSGSGTNFSALLNSWDVVAPGASPATDQPWNALLRPDAVKIWLHFNDATSGDGSSTDGYPGTFDEILYREHPEQFGASAADGRLIYHAFTGIVANTPTESPYESSAPIVSVSCIGPGFTPRPGAGYQQIAIDTNGLRYPVCQFDGYGNVFRRIADDVITVSQLPCTFTLPEPPVGEELDLETVAVRYGAGAGADDEIFLRSDPGMCSATGFTIDETAGSLELCPEACAVVESNENADARIDIAFGCDPTLL